MTDIVERLRAQQEAAEAGLPSRYVKDIWRSAADEIERLSALSQNNAHSWDAIVKERDALRTVLSEMLADLDDPELIEISAATIARARQALYIHQRQEPKP